MNTQQKENLGKTCPRLSNSQSGFPERVRIVEFMIFSTIFQRIQIKLIQINAKHEIKIS